MLELVLAEPARLQRVIAVRQPRIGVAHRRDQRIDHLRLDAVRKMPRRRHVLEAAPLVGDRLVLGEHVGDVREEAEILLEGRGERFGRLLALRLVRIDQAVERRLERQLLAVDVEAQARHRLVEEPVPGAAPGHRLLVEEPLDAVLELIGPLQPQILDPRAIDGERRRLQRALHDRVVEPVQLQPEEQQMRGDGGQPVLHVAVEFGARRIGRVAGIDEPGEAAEPAENLLDPLELRDRLGELRAAFRRFGERPRAFPCSAPRRRGSPRPPRSRSRFTSGASIAG